MTKLIQCNQCLSKLKVKERPAKGKCPRCGNLINLSAESPADSSIDQSMQATSAFNKIKSDTSIDVENIQPALEQQYLDSQTSSQQPDLDSIFQQIKRGFPKESIGIKYRLKVAFVGLSMITIPVIYLGVIASIAYSYYNFLIAYPVKPVNLFASLPVSAIVTYSLSILGYSFVVIYGGIIFLLFVKPFLGYFERPKRKLKLKRIQEPVLFQFVDHLCEMIHAPKPELIVVDLDANASVAYRTNSFFFVDKLVLTMGLPLIAKLSITEFAGILSHEFGHFTQRWGMYLTQTIRTIRHWLNKSIKEPDIVDGFITSALHSRNIFLIPVGFLLWLPVKVIQFVLRILLFISNIFCYYLLREMEFEADRFQGRLVGLEKMIDTMQHVLEINYSIQVARHKIIKNSSSENVTDNFPQYVAEISEHLPDEVLDTITILLEDSKTAFLSTHPSLTDRIRMQEEYAWPGMLDINHPAKDLFRNFRKLSQKETKKVFKHLIR